MVRDSSVTFLDGLVTGKDGVKQSAWARSISRCGGTEIVSASMDGLGEGQVGWKEEMQIRLEGRVRCVLEAEAGEVLRGAQRCEETHSGVLLLLHC